MNHLKVNLQGRIRHVKNYFDQSYILKWSSHKYVAKENFSDRSWFERKVVLDFRLATVFITFWTPDITNRGDYSVAYPATFSTKQCPLFRK